MHDARRAIGAGGRAIPVTSMDEKHRCAHAPRMLRRHDSRPRPDGSPASAITWKPPASRARRATCRFC